MNKLKYLPVILGALIASSTCTLAADFSFSFNWCSGSPEFSLKNVPKGTTKLKLNMIDHDYRNGYSHGGAVLDYTGKKKIECGDFNSQNWYPPAPPSGHIHRYEFTIDLLDKDGTLLTSAKAQNQFGFGSIIADF